MNQKVLGSHEEAKALAMRGWQRIRLAACLMAVVVANILFVGGETLGKGPWGPYPAIGLIGLALTSMITVWTGIVMVQKAADYNG